MIVHTNPLYKMGKFQVLSRSVVGPAQLVSAIELLVNDTKLI